MMCGKFNMTGKITRLAAIITAAIIVNAMLLITLDTYSWFVSKAESNAIVRAAETKDILQGMGLIDSKGKVHNFVNKNNETVRNPEWVFLQGKSNGGTYTMYFELEGNAVDYINNMQPITFSEKQEIKEAIKFKINPEQYETLKLMDDDEVLAGGYIIFKYLNSYINVPVKVEFTKGYLFEKVNTSILVMKDYEDNISELSDNILVLEKEKEELNAQIAQKEESIKNIELDINNKDEKIDELNKEISKLENEVSGLEAEIEKLKNKKDNPAPTQQPIEKPIEQPIDSSIPEDPVEQPADLPASEEPAEQPAEQPADTSAQEEPAADQIISDIAN